MKADTSIQPVSWHLALLAIVPGIIEVLWSLWETTQTHVSGFNPVMIACPLIALAALIQWRRTQAFPLWGLMAIGYVTAYGIIMLIVGIASLFGVVPGPARPGFNVHTFVVNLSFMAQMALMLGLSIWGYVRWGRTHRPPVMVWVLAAAALIVPLLRNPGLISSAIYGLVVLGFGLIFSRRHGQTAILVFIGVVLGWMWILDIDYALGIYFTKYWLIDVYNIVWRVLVFVLSPILVMRLASRTGRVWGGVLPIAAAMIIERSFYWVVMPNALPEHWLPFAVTALFDPITLAVAIGLLLYEPPASPSEPAPAAGPASMPEAIS